MPGCRTELLKQCACIDWLLVVDGGASPVSKPWRAKSRTPRSLQYIGPALGRVVGAGACAPAAMALKRPGAFEEQCLRERLAFVRQLKGSLSEDGPISQAVAAYTSIVDGAAAAAAAVAAARGGGRLACVKDAALIHSPAHDPAAECMTCAWAPDSWLQR